MNSAQNYTDNQWHHLAATYDGTKVRMYWDGLPVDSSAATGTLTTDGNLVQIGRFGDYGAYFSGSIDEVFIDDTALTASEVNQLMQGGLIDLLGDACDPDDDNDGTNDDVDGCPLDANKIAPGACGCGNPDIDADNDGYFACTDDCDDTDETINPGATEVCNDIDDDCDGMVDEGSGTFYADTDGDTYGDPDDSVAACTAPDGYVANDDDCDDTDTAINPDATEVCNGIDDDCDGMVDEGGGATTFYADSDADTYGDPDDSVLACTAPDGYVANDDDCDDTNAAVNPDATEVACNGIDDDCDGMVDYIVPVTAALPYTQSFEGPWVDGCATRDAVTLAWRNTPATGNASWRRNNDGAAAGWTSPSGGVYTPTSTDGARSARFHSDKATNGSTGSLDLHIDLGGGHPTKRISFDYTNRTGTDFLQVFLSSDGGATFSQAGPNIGTTGNMWKPYSLDVAATSSTSVVRFRATSDNGTTDIGLDRLQITSVPDCGGAPVASSTVSSANPVCGYETFTLSLGHDYSGEAGITYQWQQSTNGTTWTAISGATNPTVNRTQTAAKHYRCQVTCTNSSTTTTSTPLLVPMKTADYYTGGLPYSFGFEDAWIDGCDYHDSASENWYNSTLTGNKSWRRDDDGATAAWSNVGSGMYSPAASEGGRSARFHAHSNAAGQKGNLNLKIDLSGGSAAKVISFDRNSPTAGNTLKVQVSYGGGFTTLATFSTATSGWAPHSLNISTNSATCTVRFVAESVGGSPMDIGLDNITVANTGEANGNATNNLVGSNANGVSIGDSEAATFSVTAVYPVPTSQGVTVEFEAGEDGEFTLNVTDVAGRLVMVQKVSATAGFNRTDVDMGGLAAGMYFFRLGNGEERTTFRVVKE